VDALTGESGTAASAARVKFVAAWASLLALKLAIAMALPPFGDEAFYAWEAVHPAWAYSDLPAGTAWLIALGTAVAGDTLFGLRWPFVLLGAVLPWMVVRLAARIAPKEQAWRAGLWTLPLPLMLPLGIMALPDALLTVAILAALDALVGLANDSGSWRASRWHPLHAQFALALVAGALAHYRFGPVLAIGGLVALKMLPRATLRAPGLWVAIGAGALAWWPLLAFNATVGDAGWRFQFVDRHPWAFDPRGLLQPVAQALIVTPVLYGLLLAALWRGARQGGPARLAAISAAGLLLMYAALAPFTDRARFSLHWPLPAYLVAAAFLPALVDDLKRRGSRLPAVGATLAIVGSVLVGIAFAAPAVPALVARTAGTSLYPDNFLGWREIADAVRQVRRPDDVLVADHFMLAAQLSFALDREPRVFVLDHWNNRKHGRAPQLALWGYDEAGLDRLTPGTPILLLFEPGETPLRDRAAWVDRTCRWFDGLAPLSIVEGPGGGKSFWVYRGLRRAGDPPAACPVPLPGSASGPSAQ
jgi:hypothetical protein